ncbi:DUF2946 family protein [Massilia sp. Se16.2.3]|uniref:DUF2946 family protein n=1 Tax=Massilia sp. Se16.2.3 TaxID=2709303 RepID=UPI0015FF196A|nr:DUF2946 domain-containing protein [Massilia sp. Se16.2.3]
MDRLAGDAVWRACTRPVACRRARGAPSLPAQSASALPLQPGAQSFGFPICSAAGHAAPVQAGGDDVDPGKGAFTHCPYCADHHHAPALLPQSAGGLLPLGSASHPPLFYTAPEPLFHWAAPLSRAPPFSS